MIELKITPQPDKNNEHYYKYLIENKCVKIINGEYHWTEEHLRKSIGSLIRFWKSLNSPYWKVYYKSSDFFRRKVRNFISAIHFAWEVNQIEKSHNKNY